MKKLLFTLMSVAALLGWSTVSAQGTYSKITSADDLVDGGVYLIACESTGWIMSGNSRSAYYRGYYEATINGSITTEVAEDISDELPFAITLESVAGGSFALKDEVTGKYLGYSTTASSKNNLVNVDEATAWNITFSDGDAKIELVSAAGRTLQVNSASNSMRFSTFTSNQTAVQLYKRGEYVDEKAPEIKNISTTNATTVEVLFNEALDATSAETVANYTVNNGITVSAAQLGDDN